MTDAVARLSAALKVLRPELAAVLGPIGAPEIETAPVLPHPHTAQHLAES